MSEFRYSTADQLDGLVLNADLDSYGGGGYIFRVKVASFAVLYGQLS